MHQTVEHLLNQAAISLNDNRREARLLLANVLAVTETEILTYPDKVKLGQMARFYGYVRRRAQGEPVAKITGRKEFWSLDFKVNTDVLDPRPESELLIEVAVELFQDQEPQYIMGLGLY